MASVFKKMNVVMNLLIPVKHALRTNIGWNVMNVPKTSVMDLQCVLTVRNQLARRDVEIR